jgi:5,10-methylene-tetrahydrofolate dehydrogenase/methenyl tetrahydrofolate cyclohydrolase
VICEEKDKSTWKIVQNWSFQPGLSHSLKRIKETENVSITKKNRIAKEMNTKVMTETLNKHTKQRLETHF